MSMIPIYHVVLLLDTKKTNIKTCITGQKSCRGSEGPNSHYGQHVQIRDMFIQAVQLVAAQQEHIFKTEQLKVESHVEKKDQQIHAACKE